MRRSWGIALACLALAGGTASASPPDAPRPRALGLPELPPRLEAAAARQRAAGGSNLMFAHLPMGGYKGYRWSVVAYKARPSAPTALTIGFGRSAAQDTQFQSSEFSWTLGRRALRMDRDLRPASLRTRDGMGSNGAISMELAGRGQYLRVPAGDGCTGAISVRTASFSGRFRFNARDLYFRKIELSRAPVILYREHDLRCQDDGQPPPPSSYCPPELFLEAVDEESGLGIGAFRTAQGRVDQHVVVERRAGDADSVHSISVELAVPEAFQGSEDVSSATVDGDAGGPWLSGDLSYVAPPATDETNEDCGPYRQSNGIVTGDYTAHFDSIGPVTPSAGMAATLRRDL
jgi:hypothetical protein